MIINQSNLKALYVAFSTAFNNMFASATPEWKKIATEIPSTTAENQYGWLGKSTGFREWLGERVIQNLKVHDFSIKNKTFENTVGVPRENIEDDQYGVFSPLFAQLGQDAAEHPDTLVWPLLPAGFTNLCYDGQYFFDTDHPVTDAAGVAQSVSNFGGGAGTAWYLVDNSRVIKPLIFQKRRDYKFTAKDSLEDENVFNRKEFLYGVDARANAGYGLWQLAYASKQTLDEASLGAAIAAMRSLKGDNARPLNVRPTLLVVPPSLEMTARKLVTAEFGANGSSNVLNGVVEVVVSGWLA